MVAMAPCILASEEVDFRILLVEVVMETAAEGMGKFEVGEEMGKLWVVEVVVMGMVGACRVLVLVGVVMLTVEVEVEVEDFPRMVEEVEVVLYKVVEAEVSRPGEVVEVNRLGEVEEVAISRDKQEGEVSEEVEVVNVVAAVAGSCSKELVVAGSCSKELAAVGRTMEVVGVVVNLVVEVVGDVHKEAMEMVVVVVKVKVAAGMVVEVMERVVVVKVVVAMVVEVMEMVVVARVEEAMEKVVAARVEEAMMGVEEVASEPVVEVKVAAETVVVVEGVSTLVVAEVEEEESKLAVEEEVNEPVEVGVVVMPEEQLGVEVKAEAVAAKKEQKERI